MRRQYRIILETALKGRFVPAFEVKRQREFPTEYRKRCSELVEKGWLINAGKEGQFGAFEITWEGRQALIEEPQNLMFSGHQGQAQMQLI